MRFRRFTAAILGSALFFLSSTQGAKAEEPIYSFNYLPLSAWNFGVVKANPEFTLYRSQLLGDAGLQAIFQHLRDHSLPLPKTIINMNVHGYSDDDQSALEEIHAQKGMHFDFFHSFAYAYRTYLDGRNPYFPSEDVDTGGYLGTEALREIGMIRDDKVDGGVDAFLRILDLVLDPARQPVLFHCKGGRHRTGMVALALRYIEGGEWLEGSHEVRTFPLMRLRYLNNAQYEYFVHTRQQFREENLQFIDSFFRNDPRGQDYVRRFRTRLALLR